MKLLSILLLLTTPAWSAPWGKLNKISKFVLAGSQTLDIVSSYQNTYELNPILRSHTGQFETKGVVLKAGITAGILLVQWRLEKIYPAETQKPFAISNFTLSAITTGVAVHNWRMK